MNARLRLRASLPSSNQYSEDMWKIACLIYPDDIELDHPLSAWKLPVLNPDGSWNYDYALEAVDLLTTGKINATDDQIMNAMLRLDEIINTIMGE